ILYGLDGRAYVFQEYTQGKRDGYFIMLTKDYQLKGIARVGKGGHNTLDVSFYENGYIEYITTAGVFHNGVSIDFFNNGKLKSWVRIIEGKANGWEYIYDRKGRLLKKEFYKNGNLIRVVDKKE